MQNSITSSVKYRTNYGFLMNSNISFALTGWIHFYLSDSTQRQTRILYAFALTQLIHAHLIYAISQLVHKTFCFKSMRIFVVYVLYILFFRVFIDVWWRGTGQNSAKRLVFFLFPKYIEYFTLFSRRIEVDQQTSRHNNLKNNENTKSDYYIASLTIMQNFSNIFWSDKFVAGSK